MLYFLIYYEYIARKLERKLELRSGEKGLAAP
jgi:hypothetical protein